MNEWSVHMAEIKKDLLSIVVPCFNEAEGLETFYYTVCEYLHELPIHYEFVFVDDGSQDQTLAILHQLSIQDPHVFYDSFSRNFGKEAAMYAGLHGTRGNYVVMMDADLQHPPSLLASMYQLVTSKGVDCAGAKRMTRDGEGKLRNMFTKVFYRFLNRICSVQMDDGAGDYRMMSRQMVDSLLAFHEVNRYTKGLFSYIGYHTEWITYENVERIEGESKWSLRSLFLYAIDGITAFSNVPLLLAAGFGIAFCLIAFLMFLYLLFVSFDKLFFITCLLLMIGGIQLLFTGILGEYLAKNVAESRHRPMYIVKESNLHH